MNTLTKTMSTSTKNMAAMAEHTIGAMIGIFIILGQFNKSFDKDLWIYMVIFLPIFTGSFVFKSEEEKRRVGTSVASLNLAMIILFIRSRRQ